MKWFKRALLGAVLAFVATAASAMVFPNQDRVLMSAYPTGNAAASTIRLRPDGTMDWIPGGFVSPYRPLDAPGWFDTAQGCSPSCTPTPGANFDITWGPANDTAWQSGGCSVVAATTPQIETGPGNYKGDMGVDQFITIGAVPDQGYALCTINIVIWFKGTIVDASVFKVNFIFQPGVPYNNSGYLPGGNYLSSFIDNAGSYFGLQGAGFFDNERVSGGFQFPSSPQQWYSPWNYNPGLRPGDWSSYRINISGDTSMLTLDTGNSAACASSGSFKPLGGGVNCTVGWKNYGGATVGYVYQLIVRVELIKTTADLTPAVSTFTFTYRMRKCGPWGC